MKIRTDFVTNSSSYSSAEVVIDNPVLMEILIKYKEMGTFNNLPVEEEIQIGDPAFRYEAPEAYEAPCPGTLADVLWCLIEALKDANDSDEDDEARFGQLIDELYQREEEINSVYVSVDWRYRLDMQSDAFKEEHFLYTINSGESYTAEQEGDDEDFEF